MPCKTECCVAPGVNWSEPLLPIKDREDPARVVPKGGCPGDCLYGTCSAPGSTYGCGGCCWCLGGCQVEYEQMIGAPLVWTGDSA